MELTILTVRECPHAPLLEERLAEALSGLSGVSLVRRMITDEQEAVRSGMRGSPTLLIDGLDPFGDPAAPPGMSCRIYRDGDGRMEPVPSVAALRRALTPERPSTRPAGWEPWSDPLGRFGAGRVAPIEGGLRAVHQGVLRSFAVTGRAPESTVLAEAAAPYGADPEAVLAELHAADFVRLDEAGRIRAAYPFSARPTAHVVHIAGGPKVFAMCAIDALGIAAMLGTDVRIHSSDPVTGDRVTVVAMPAGGRGTEWDPATAVVFAGSQADCAPWDLAGPAAVDVCCGHVNFFATTASAADWERTHPHVTGRILAQPDAEDLGTQIFGPLLAETT